MKRNKLSLMMAILLLCSIEAIAQRPQYKMGTNVNSGFRNQVLLELEDTSQALILTRVRRSPNLVFGNNAYRGMIVFDSTVNQLAYYDGSAWKYPITSLSASQNIYNTDDALTSNRTVTMNANNLTFNSTNGNFIFNPSGAGKVGIGTRNPQNVLHVYDSITTGNNNSTPLQINAISTANTRLRLSNMSTGGNGNGIEFFVSGSASGMGSKKFSILKYNDFGVPQTPVITIDSNNNVAIGAGFTTPISTLHVRGAVRADSLILTSNSLYKKLNTTSDSIAIIDSVGRVMKVGVNDILNGSTSNNSFDWTLGGFASSTIIGQGLNVGGKTSLYNTIQNQQWNGTATITMSNYMYAKDSVSVQYDVWATAWATGSRPNSGYYLLLYEYSDVAGTQIQVDTLRKFLVPSGTATALASGISTGWNNNLVSGIALRSNTRYVKLQFVFINKDGTSTVTGAFANVNISTPTVSTNVLNYVQGGNSFGTMGILGLTDKNNLSIITNNVNRLFIDTIGNVGIGTNNPISRLQVSGAMRADSLVLNSLTAGAGSDSILTINTATGVVRRVAPTTIKPSVDTSIYSFDGTLKGNRVVTMNANDLTFNSTAGNFIFNPSGSGKFGIGTSTPSRGLEVSKGIIADSLTLVGSNNLLKFVKGTTSNSPLFMEFYKEGTSSSNYGSRSGYIGFGSSSTNDFLIMNQLSGKIGIGTDNTERITILSSGNVGIGTNNPISRLQVSGAVRADSLALVSLSNKGTMSGRDSLLMIDSVGVVKKVAPATVTTASGITSILTASLNNTKNSNGITVNTVAGVATISLQEADATNPGLVTSNAQTFAGNKTFTGQLTATNVGAGASTDSILTINTSGVIRRISASSIKPATDTSIYSFDGTLKGNRTVTMGNNNLSFNSGNGNFIFNPTGTGNVGIGIVAPKYKLDVKGLINGDTIVTKGIKLVDAAGNFNGYGMSGNWGITTVSDERLKENIKPYSGPNALQGINSINIVEYDWKASKVGDPNRHMPIGVIAQNVQKVFPDAVQFDSQSGNLTLRSMLFSFYLMKATQELSKEVDGLKKENQKLSQEISESKKANQELKQKMEKLEQIVNQLISNQKK